MHDLRDAVIHLQRARDVALLANRQQLFDIAGLGAEEGQYDVAGVVAGIHEIGRAGVARRRWAVAIDGDLQRHHGSLDGVADLWPRTAVDDLARQMQQQVNQARRLIAAEQVLQQLVLLRTDAGQAGHGSKQRIERAGAHESESRIDLAPLARLYAGHPRLFSRRSRGQRAMPNRGLTGAVRVAISRRPGTSGLSAFDWI
ncbi:hypothetical protein ABIF75_010848 [Bradyrhizobium japonicum]